ncbi:type II toxin-antitoxin system Phd/YefM family antitoxin [Methanolapillus millepedarum]|uniref:Antitoxin n=1 Tax=Methanolapillus millepedarum TaxID=3028296 RepID=A0AA96ZW38_9EURY|nr:hypothetical protein MsAc7_10590 [Methanosarcinaceae archaeon Ac7]
MNNRYPSVNLHQTFVPISRFNKGDAKKIFEEVDATGMKTVLKNNKPVCVLLSISKYEEMIEMIEDQLLLEEAERRMENATGEKRYSYEEVLEKLGIDEKDIENTEVEID